MAWAIVVQWRMEAANRQIAELRGRLAAIDSEVNGTKLWFFHREVARVACFIVEETQAVHNEEMTRAFRLQGAYAMRQVM